MIDGGGAAGEDYLVGQSRLELADEIDGGGNTIGIGAGQADNIGDEAFGELDDLIGGLALAEKSRGDAVLAKKLEQDFEAQGVRLTGSAYAKEANPGSEERTIEAAAEFADEFVGGIDDELLTFGTYVILGAFLSHHGEGGKDNVDQGGLEAIFIAIADGQRMGASAIDLEQFAVVVVIIFAALLGAEQDSQEAEGGDIVAGDLETGSKRGREEESGQAPEPGPEHGGHQQGEGREADAVADQERLDKLTGDLIEDNEGSEDFGGFGPAGEDREGDEGGQNGGDQSADIRYEPEYKGERAPEYRIGQAQRPHDDRDRATVAEIDEGKEQQVMRDGAAGGGDSFGGKGNANPGGETNEAVAEILAAVEQEKKQDDDQQAVGEIGENRDSRFEDLIDGGRTGGGLNNSRRSFGARSRLLELLLDVLNAEFDVRKPSGRSALNLTDLLRDVFRMVSDTDCDCGKLNGQEVAKRGNRADDSSHDQSGTGKATYKALEAAGDVAEDDGEDRGHRQGHENVLGEIEDRGGDYEAEDWTRRTGSGVIVA